MKNLLRFLAFVLLVGTAHAQSNLPACPASLIIKYQNGDKGCLTDLPLSQLVDKRWKSKIFEIAKNSRLYMIAASSKCDAVSIGTSSLSFSHSKGEASSTALSGCPSECSCSIVVDDGTVLVPKNQATLYGVNKSTNSDKLNLVGSAPLKQTSVTNQTVPLVAVQLDNSERDRLAAEVDAERNKSKELEQQLAAAKDRERITSELDLERKKRQELEAQLAATVQPTPPQTIVQRRTAHALVIGNGAYPGSGRLDNPVNDANAISQKLRSMGFTVTTVTDANRQKLVQSMAQFRRTAASADISLLYYAGHGVQIFGTNYILPTDVDQTDPAQATIQGVSLNSVVENFLPGKTKLVFLDACRDNALQRTNDRSISKGLAPISAAEGTLISYATKDGQTAADGVGSKNSPFTQALLEHLNDPQDIAVVLRKVRERVMKITGGKQQPWEYGSLTGGELVLSAIKPK